MKWTVNEQGPRAVVEVWRPDDGGGLYKVWAIGPGGRCLLGTLMPEKEGLHLRRVLSVDSLRRQGAWPVQRVEEVLAFPFQQEDGGPSFQDPVLRRSARELPRHTMRREGDGFSLAFPFDPRSPFPLTPAFCFARVEGGKLVFSFRGDGMPYISPAAGKDRGEVDGQRGEYHGESDHKGAPRAGGPAGV